MQLLSINIKQINSEVKHETEVEKNAATMSKISSDYRIRKKIISICPIGHLPNARFYTEFELEAVLAVHWTSQSSTTYPTRMFNNGSSITK